MADDWIANVERIFREENLSYTINEKGEVHFAQDEEFQTNRLATVSALSGPRYRAALEHFEEGQRALDNTPPRTREAIRQTYEAVETAFRLLFPEVKLLGAGEVQKEMPKVFLEGREGSERDCLRGNIAAFKDWVISVQGYRHGQGVEKPDNPSISTTVLVVSAGASYLRWLVEEDAAIRGETNQTAAGT